MKCLRISLAFLAALVFTPLLGAQTKTPPATTARHSLWKIEGKTNAVYLFGSIHFLKQEFYPLDAAIEDAFKKAGTVMFETDLSAAEDLSAQLKILQMAQYPAGETLADNLTAETYRAFQKKVKELTGIEKMFDQFKPWMASMTLLIFELQRLGFNPQSGLDKHFYDQAKTDKKKISWFESPEFQIKLLDDFSKEDQERFLKSTLEDLDRFEKVFSEIINAWKTGDAKKIDTLISDDMRKYPSLYKKLLTDRNQSWLPKIEEILKSGPDTFIVVGAAHLVGKDGVVELLTKKGYKIQQL